MRERLVLLAALATAPLATLAAPACSAPPQASPPALTLVESAPVETTLDQPDLPPTEQAWRSMIETARRDLALAHFYASNRSGSRLEPVIQALLAAAARGVRVRFLVDDGMARTYPETLERLATQPGIEVRRYDMAARTGGVHHAKYLVADGEEVCVGSANFDWRSLEHIQELGLRLRSPALAGGFLDVFDLDWRLAGGDEAPVGNGRPAAMDRTVEAAWADASVRVTPLFSPKDLLPPGAEWDLPRLVAAIDAARDRVFVQLLSFRATGRDGRPFQELDRALRAAAARGVDVRLLVADWSKREHALEELLHLQRGGIRVRFLAIPPAAEGAIPYARVAHAKYLVADDHIAWIGTSNWSGAYFYAGRNAGLLVEGDAFAPRLARFFLDNWQSRYAEELAANGRAALPVPTSTPSAAVPAPSAPAAAAPTAAAPTAKPDRDGRWPAPEQLVEIVRVIDGDTIHVRRGGQVVKLRLLSVDTEEKGSPGSAPSATKPATPFGNDTAQWAQRFFAPSPPIGGPSRVGLLFPDGKETLDRYGRLLCHVLLPDGGDYNLLLVREGKSPYFNKYGNSTICHAAFVATQQEARAAGRGIWDPRTNAPTDGGEPAARRPYEQVLPWWDARAAAIDAFRAAHAADPETRVSAEDADALRAAAERGHEVEVFGTIDELTEDAGGGLSIAFAAPAGAPALRALVPAAARPRLATLHLEATTRELRQNYVWLKGRVVDTAAGFSIAAGDPAQWRVAEPAFPPPR